MRVPCEVSETVNAFLAFRAVILAGTFYYKTTQLYVLIQARTVTYHRIVWIESPMHVSI